MATFVLEIGSEEVPSRFLPTEDFFGKRREKTPTQEKFIERIHRLQLSLIQTSVVKSANMNHLFCRIVYSH